MYLLTVHLVVFDGVQIIFEPFIGYQTIVVVLEIKFVLHGIVQSVSDYFSDELLSHNFVALVPVSL